MKHGRKLAGAQRETDSPTMNPVLPLLLPIVITLDMIKVTAVKDETEVIIVVEVVMVVEEAVVVVEATGTITTATPINKMKLITCNTITMVITTVFLKLMKIIVITITQILTLILLIIIIFHVHNA